MVLDAWATFIDGHSWGVLGVHDGLWGEVKDELQWFGVGEWRFGGVGMTVYIRCEGVWGVVAGDGDGTAKGEPKESSGREG